MKDLNLAAFSPAARTATDMRAVLDSSRPSSRDTGKLQKTSIDMYPGTHRRAKIYALTHGILLRDLMDQALNDWMDRHE